MGIKHCGTGVVNDVYALVHIVRNWDAERAGNDFPLPDYRSSQGFEKTDRPTFGRSLGSIYTIEFHTLNKMRITIQPGQIHWRRKATYAFNCIEVRFPYEPFLSAGAKGGDKRKSQDDTNQEKIHPGNHNSQNVTKECIHPASHETRAEKYNGQTSIAHASDYILRYLFWPQ
jgi:hypothetical protein